jgi:catechol 2,3-dioxygenase-like lactoylglutathione lyase family enzyme
VVNRVWEGKTTDTTCELHHTAYRVKDIVQSIDEWCRRFGARVELPPTLISSDRVLVAFLLFAGGRIELIQPVDDPQKTPAPRRPDHVCLLCPDFDERIGRVSDEGGIITRETSASEAFEMRRTCFVLYADVGLVEFVDSRRNATANS